MLVVYTGHNKVLMTDFNGKRYCLEKNKPTEIPQQIYDFIILSEHVDAIDLKVVLPPEKIIGEAPVKEKKEKIPEKKESKHKKRR